ncbi:MAG: OmpA family protein [Gammaproteobacteria bacterium]|nr:OmpA family protein [Gammaproteobacteria bacterium]
MHKSVFYSKKTRYYAVIGLMGAAALISGCSTTPAHHNASLERAKGIIAEIKSDPASSENEAAAQYLAEADQALAKSQYKNDSLKFFRPGDDQEGVDHWAYIAEQKALTAQTMLQGGGEAAELAQLKTELDQAKLAKQDRDAAEALRLEEERLAQEKLQQQHEAELQAALQRAEDAGADVVRAEGLTTVTFNNVSFASNKATLPHEFESELINIAEALTTTAPEATLVVRGHSDASGAEAYNQLLSEKRATSVKTFLITQGVASNRVSSEGLGESTPVASNDSAEGRAKNRRVELIISETGH